MLDFVNPAGTARESSCDGVAPVLHDQGPRRSMSPGCHYSNLIAAIAALN
jgi:hypothetical protein